MNPHSIVLPECQGTLSSVAKWMSVPLRTKWFWVRITLLSLEKVFLERRKFHLRIHCKYLSNTYLIESNRLNEQCTIEDSGSG